MTFKQISKTYNLYYKIKFKRTRSFYVNNYVFRKAFKKDPEFKIYIVTININDVVLLV